MNGIALAVATVSLLLFVLSLFSVYLMLYSWEHPSRLEASEAPKQRRDPALSFTVLLPARHEQAVIRETVRRVWAVNYPRELLEVVVICSQDDVDTIAEAQRAVREIGSPRVRLEVFADGPINKPHGLNVGLARTSNEVVTVFDAEDDVDPEILNVVNTVMLTTGAGVVQSGVQLMNFRDHWFSVHNCLEYFFWFKSRLHFHAGVGTIPLGGNTVFMRRDLVNRAGGWDEQCLTEDADIGFRLSTLGEPIRVVYDAQHVTREETPHTIAQLVKQRTRWHQGFLQVLAKGDWLRLPSFRQRLLAVYTLAYPLVQAVLLLVWPFALMAVLWLKLPVPIALLSFLPLYALLFQLLVTLLGVMVFAREYRLRVPLHLPLVLVATFLPYQWILGASSVRAAGRALLGRNNWEKTDHTGAHRAPALPFAAHFEPTLHQLGELLDMEQRSLLLVDPESNSLSAVHGHRLPDRLSHSVQPDGVIEWVMQERRPLIVEARPPAGRAADKPLGGNLGTSVVVPIEEGGAIVAVMVLSTEGAVALPDKKIRHLTQFLDQVVNEPATVPGLDRMVV